MIVNTIIDVAPEQIVRVVKAGGVEIIDSAKLPLDPSSPNIKMNTLIGVFHRFFLSFVIIILIVKFDTKVRDEEDLTKSFTIPVLGSIPTLVAHNAGQK
jgi:capsular polysaccharide biosynthesis protein